MCVCCVCVYVQVLGGLPGGRPLLASNTVIADWAEMNSTVRDGQNGRGREQN